MVSPCGGTYSRYSDGEGTYRDSKTTDCGDACSNCGKHNYNDDFFLCGDCEEKKLSRACKKAIRSFIREHGVPPADFPLAPSVLEIIKAMNIEL